MNLTFLEVQLATVFARIGSFDLSSMGDEGMVFVGLWGLVRLLGRG